MEDEIIKQFEYLSSIDYKENYSIGEICNHFGSNSNGGLGHSGFGVEKKQSLTSTEGQIRKFQKAVLFGKVLLEHGNLKFAIKLSGISRRTAHNYISLLNKESVTRGLPEIIIYYNLDNHHKRKLSEKQVGYIKYLVTKYPIPKVAKMYGVNASTISLIRSGQTWKNIPAAIINETPVTYINQFLKQSGDKRYAVDNKNISDEDLLDTDGLIDFFVKLKWGEKVICPFCNCDWCWGMKSEGKYSFRCSRNISHNFTLTSNTVLSSSKLSLAKIRVAILLYITDKKTSSVSLSKDIKCSQKTAYYLLEKIKIASPKTGVDFNKGDTDFYLKAISKKLLETKSQ